MKNFQLWRIAGSNFPRKVELVFLALFLSLPLQAKAPVSLSLGLGNDWYTLGFGHSLDDGLSFGTSAQLRFENGLSIHTDFLSYTKRDEHKRYDTLSLTVSYPFWMNPTETLILSLKPSAGLLASGNLGLQDIQNLYHLRIGRDQLDLEYVGQHFALHPLLSLSTQAGYQRRGLVIGAELESTLAIGWESELEAGIFVSVEEALTVRLGYVHRFNPQDITKSWYVGPKLSLDYDGGLVNISYYSYLETGLSYGTLGIDVLGFARTKSYREEDFAVTSGIAYNLLGHQNRILAFAVGPISFEIGHTNGPMKNLWGDQSYRMNLGSWLAAYRWNLTGDASLFTPYVKALAGLQRFNLQEYTSTLVEQVRPSIGIEVGTFHGFWVTGNKQYRLRLAASFHYVFGTQSIESPEVPQFLAYAKPWIAMAGIAVQISHDLGIW